MKITIEVPDDHVPELLATLTEASKYAKEQGSQLPLRGQQFHTRRYIWLALAGTLETEARGLSQI